MSDRKPTADERDGGAESFERETIISADAPTGGGWLSTSTSVSTRSRPRDMWTYGS